MPNANDELWWIQPLVTATSIVVGAGMIVWQQRAGKRSELKLKLFEQLRAGLTKASDAVSAAGIYAMMAPMNIATYWQMLNDGVKAGAPHNRIPKFNDLHFAATASITDLICLLEAHDIVSEHFHLFRQALSCVNHQVIQMQGSMQPLLYKSFPMEVPNSSELYIPRPTTAEMSQLKSACDAYQSRMQELSSYIHDIGNEAQNALLKPLFRRRVPPRDPPDPKYWVLRTDDKNYLKKVRKYFFEEHPIAAKNLALTAELRDAAKADQ